MARVYVKSYGCSLNMSDSEGMMGLIKEDGHNIVLDENMADIVVVNSCAVKSPTVNKIKRYIFSIVKKKIPIVFAGCIPKAYPDFLEKIKSDLIKKKKKNTKRKTELRKIKKKDILNQVLFDSVAVSIIGPNNIFDICMVIDETLKGNSIQLVTKEKVLDKKFRSKNQDNSKSLNRLKLPVLRKNSIVEIIPVCRGCLGKPCSYCIVKKARGELHSYDIYDIINRVNIAVKQGVKEVWLTAQDTGCYGFDIGTNIVELLKNLVNIKGDFKIRLGMANPNHIIEMLDDLIEIFKHEKMFKFLHIPVQSGSDEVLNKMKREYTIKDFTYIIQNFRKNIPEIAFSTDIICGFPEETDDDFEKTVKLVKEMKFDVLNISKFWLRPGTIAEKLKQVSGEIIKKRSQKLTRIFRREQEKLNKTWIGKKSVAIVDEKGKKGTKSMIARNESYKPVILDNFKGDIFIGDIFSVEIIDSKGHDLYGKIIKK